MSLECDRDYQRGAACRCPSFRRKVLESAYLAQAVHTIFSTPKLGSNHMAVSHCEGEASASNAHPTRPSGWRPSAASTCTPTTGIADSARAKVKDTGLGRDAVLDLSRQARARAPLSPSVTGRRQAHARGFPFGLLRRLGLALVGVPAAAAQQSGNLVATSAMILMRPGEGHLEACPMPALKPPIHELHADARPDRQRQAAE